jgi:sn-glycerol 3-phosphate transport system permease protein
VIFDPNAGIVEHWLNNLFGITLPNYRQDPQLAQALVILASVWKTLGYNLLFYIAGLQNVRTDLLEAASDRRRERLAAVPQRRHPGPVAHHLLPRRDQPHLRVLRDLRHDRLPHRRRTGGCDQRRDVRDLPGRDPGRDLGRGAAQSLILFAGVIALTAWQFRSTGRRVSYGN